MTPLRTRSMVAEQIGAFMKRTAPLLTLGISAAVGCSPQNNSPAMHKRVAAELKRSLDLDLPATLTNSGVAAIRHNTWSEGRTTIYVCRYESDESGVTSLRDELNEKGVTLFRSEPPNRGSDKDYPSWWSPSSYGVCDSFLMSTQLMNTRVELVGYISRERTQSGGAVLFTFVAINSR